MSALAFHQIGHRVDQPAIGGRVGQLHGLANLSQAQSTHAGAMRLLGPDRAPDERHLDSSRTRFRHAHPVISSTFLPRLAAISAGVVIAVSPLMVARTTL